MLGAYTTVFQILLYIFRTETRNVKVYCIVCAVPVLYPLGVMYVMLGELVHGFSLVQCLFGKRFGNE